MKKNLIFVLCFLIVGCGIDEGKTNLSNGNTADSNDNVAEDTENNPYPNTDYYYETENQSIFDGHQKMKEKDFKGAEEYFTKAIEELPHYAYAYAFRAWAKMESKNFSGALIDIDKAIEIADDVSEFYAWRAEIYRSLGDFSQSNADFVKAKQLLRNKTN